MKKFVFFLIILGFAFGLESFGQSKLKSHLIYGPLDDTGFQKIKKGAMWSKRPWVKTIFEGGALPEGCDTLTITEDSFGMFAQNEHNDLDRNFIIFPAGSKFIKKGGELYYAYCGNKVQTLRPVVELDNMISGIEKGIKIVHDTVWVETPGRLKETDTKEEEKVDSNVNKEKPEHGKFYYWQKKNGIWFYPLTGIVTGTAAGFIFHSKGYTWYHLWPTGTAHQAHMSGGFGDENVKTSTPTTGGNVGNGSGFSN